MNEAEKVLVQLGDEFIAIATSTKTTWEKTKTNLRDPVTLERFALSAHTGAQALIQLAERVREQAGELLDGDE